MGPGGWTAKAQVEQDLFLFGGGEGSAILI